MCERRGTDKNARVYTNNLKAAVYRPTQLFHSGTPVYPDEHEPAINDWVSRPIEPLGGRHVDAIVGYDGTSGAGKRKPPAGVGGAPVGTALLGARPPQPQLRFRPRKV